MAQGGLKRRLTAILSADVEGYSRLMRDNEEATIQILTVYRTAMANLIQQYRGRVVDAPGDNLLAEFGSVVDAVNCAVEIQRELAERNADLPEERKMQFRIGVNLGDVFEEGDRIYGDGVNIAARMESLAEAGGICISGTVHDSIVIKLGLEYEYLGEQAVKNIPELIRSYRVLSYPGAAAHRVVKAKRDVQRKWRKAALAIVAVLIIGVGTVAIWKFFLRPFPPPVEAASEEKMAFPLPEKPSIAVLPFVNMSGDPKQEHIADGITENIITTLSKDLQLFVIARTSTFIYKGKSVKIKQVSEELGVRYVLEGSVQKEGDRIRITAQLVDALKGHHLWAEKYDRDLGGFFNLLDEITKKIGVALQVKLIRGEFARFISDTDNFEAWEYVREGWSEFYRHGREDVAKARELAERALKLDPDYVGALVLLSACHGRESEYGWSASKAESLKKAIELTQKAMALDENNPAVHLELGVNYRRQGMHEKAIAAHEKSCHQSEHC
jgi:TolB-like protein/class 3 adenylate cyclase